MNWKEQLKILENNKQWDMGIELMQEVIRRNPDDLDAYLSINYLLMNLLVEEDYDDAKFSYYAHLLKKYFDESYAKFSQNPEYLYFIARIAVMSEWYFGIEQKDIETMLYKAMELDPENLVYKWTYYSHLDENDAQNKDQIIYYAKVTLSKDSPIKKALELKGSLGEYIWSMMEYCAKEILEKT